MRNPVTMFAFILLFLFASHCFAKCTECTKSIPLNNDLTACYSVDGRVTDMVVSPANKSEAVNTIAFTKCLGIAGQSFANAIESDEQAQGSLKVTIRQEPSNY